MNIAVIFAGGAGKRMRSRGNPKQFLEVHGKPIIIYTLEIFQNHHDIDKIVVSCIKEWIPHLNNLIEKFGITKVSAVVEGGNTGQESIYHGLVKADEIGDGDDIVLIHDGVRPLIDEETITANITGVKEHGSAITSSVATETILVVDENEKIQTVPRRGNSRLAKAPQSFYLTDILNVHRQAIEDGNTDTIDSCTLMSMYGHDMYIVHGSDENIKITTPCDFYIFRAILQARENMQIYGL